MRIMIFRPIDDFFEVASGVPPGTCAYGIKERYRSLIKGKIAP
jgi:hypothetical protein